MKKILCLVLVIVTMINVSIINASANTASNEIYVYVDGKYVSEADVKPFIENNRTLVPVRAVTEKMGAEVLWDNDTRTVTINKPTEKMVYNGVEYFNCTAHASLIIGSNEISIGLSDKNGALMFRTVEKMDIAAKIVNERTFIPARFVGYALGYDIVWNQAKLRVDYNFIGKQTIDFEIQEEPKKPEVTNPDVNEKYPNTTTVDGKDYPSRNGYDNIVIVDTSKGKIEDNKFVNLVPYRFTENNVTIESDEKEYEISNNNTAEENFNNFSKFYEDKTGEEVEFIETSDGEKIYKMEYLTNNNVGYKYVYGKSKNSGRFLYKYLEDKEYYKIITSSPVYDYSKLYYICQDNVDIGYGNFYGQRVYGNKDDSLLRKGANKNTLLFLNSFLGENGQKVWKMISDYYTFSGYFHVPQDTEWKKFENNKPIVFDTIDQEHVEKYGLKFINSYNEIGMTILVLETNNQKIYIEYSRPYIIGDLIGGYTVVFEKIEN
ncbi:MAG: copper amine oxidase N-terminal domain-containing protein [Clostridia bacterium]|nr:copper amine oxidase N-terminal domain-containing protein [Clostridia bacterium]